MADLAGDYRGPKQRPKGGSDALLEVRSQGFKGRISRVQGRREPAFGRNKRGVSLQPFRQCLARRVFRSEERGGLRAGIDFAAEDGCDEVAALREVPVNGADADAGLFCDLSHRRVHARSREHRRGRLEQRIKVSFGVGPHAPICAAQRLNAITWDFRSNAHRSPHLTNGTLFRMLRNSVPFKPGYHRTPPPSTFGMRTRRADDTLEENMHDKPVALVTGANQGIGLQIAKDLVAHGFTVLVGSRNLERGEAAAKTIEGDARLLQLDVTDPASIAAAAERIRNELGRLDVLVNNAAISNTSMRSGQSVEEFSKSTRPSNVSLDEVRAVWETNVFGVLAVTQAMLPLLRQAPTARIVNVSSGVGSLTRNADPAFPWRSIFGPCYPASKTALNAMTLAMAIELESTGIKVNAACPGFTKTNLNNYAGTQTVEEGAREPVRLALLSADGPTGTFSNSAGPIPW